MATRLRLQRHGKKGKPFYHIVAADARASTSDAISFSNGTALPKYLPAGAPRRPCPRDVVLPTAHEALLLELLTTEAGPWGARAAECGPTDKPKRAALLLRLRRCPRPRPCKRLRPRAGAGQS